MNKDIDLIILGHNITYYRKRNKLSCKQVYTAINMEKQNYSRIENGRQNVCYKTLKSICRVIKVDIKKVVA